MKPLSTLPIPDQIAAIKTASPEAIVSAYKSHIRGTTGTRPIKLAPCPRCGAVLSVVARRKACPAHGR